MKYVCFMGTSFERGGGVRDDRVRFPVREGELGGAGVKLNFRELRLGSLDGSEFGSLVCSWSHRFFCFLPWKLGDHMVTFIRFQRAT